MRVKKLMRDWFDFRKMSPQKALTLVFVASLLLIVFTYGFWQSGRLLSPTINLSLGSVILELRASNYSGPATKPVRLVNELGGQDTPNYLGIAAPGPELTYTSPGPSGRIILPRLQGEVIHR